MNTRERFLAVMNFQPVDRTLMWEIGYWSDAVRRWHREGLPHRYDVPKGMAGGASIMGETNARRAFGGPMEDPYDDHTLALACEEEIHSYLGLDQGMVHVPLSFWMEPPFKEKILEDHGDWMVSRDASGMVKRSLKDHSSLPRFVRGAVGSREDWERIKAERFRPTLDGRLPVDWAKRLEEYSERDYPIYIGGCPAGFYGAARQLLGQERVLTTFYDEPDLMHDIMDYLADFWISIYSSVLDQVDADACFIWEDMCYKNGPLISPAMFREFMLPNYKKLSACLRDHGVSAIWVDTDGDARKLIPLFVEGGVTLLYPLEPQAGMDVVELREAFPKLGLMGGMDKRKLPEGRTAIDEELDRKIPFMIERGGYIPFLDHQAPPDISWDNYKYYREKLSAMIKR